MNVANNCDGSGPHSGTEVRILPTSPGSNVILCRADFVREISWRKERNRDLSDDAKFDLPSWESLEIYTGE